MAADERERELTTTAALSIGVPRISRDVLAQFRQDSETTEGLVIGAFIFAVRANESPCPVIWETFQNEWRRMLGK
jgi:hypothetical protein